MKRLLGIVIVVAILLAIPLVLISCSDYSNPDSEYSIIYWNHNTRVSITFDCPTAFMEMEKDGEYSRIAQRAGFYRIDSETGKVYDTGGMQIQLLPESYNAKHTSKENVPDDGAKIRFSIIPCGEKISDVKVLRWPVELFGCENPLEAAEVIPYTTEKAILRRDKDKSYFTAEKGYLYSVYITWDEYYTEYSFIAE